MKKREKGDREGEREEERDGEIVRENCPKKSKLKINTKYKNEKKIIKKLTIFLIWIFFAVISPLTDNALLYTLGYTHIAMH